MIWPSSLEVLCLYNNALTSNGLLNVTWPGNLRQLDLSGNADPVCVPMSQGFLDSIIDYWGPDPCEWTVWACEGDDYSTDIDPGSEAGCCKYEGSFNGAALVRTGSCPGFTGELHLDEKGITLINPDAFVECGATRLYLYDNKLTSVSGVIWPSSLVFLYLYDNALTSNGLLNVTWPGNLEELNLSDNDDPMTCVPMSQGFLDSIYYG